jgi:hypothetical protein
MGKRFTALSQEHISFIEKQHIYFVATAAPTGRVNLSPKGLNTLRVIDETSLVWLNLTGSGNETAAHLLQSDRMTIMFCDFIEKPLILRLYGSAKIYHPFDVEFDQYLSHFPIIAGTRQIIKLHIDLVQTSCGYAVPIMEYKEDRDTLTNWAEKQGEERIKNYWEEKNMKSIDGFETNIIG